MDDYMSIIFNKNFDKDGNIASKGILLKKKLKNFYKIIFLKNLLQNL